MLNINLNILKEQVSKKESIFLEEQKQLLSYFKKVNNMF